jgi:hypothetical protein
MILFEYFCNDDNHHEGCGHEFEVLLPIDDRIKPMGEKCPNCGKKGNVCRKYSSKLFTRVINPHKKMSEDFKSEMKRIHKEHKITSEYF